MSFLGEGVYGSVSSFQWGGNSYVQKINKEEQYQYAVSESSILQRIEKVVRHAIQFHSSYDVTPKKYFAINMERARGETLYHRLCRLHNIPFYEVVSSMKQLLECIADLEPLGIIHADLKLDNLIWQPFSLRVIDWGYTATEESKNLHPFAHPYRAPEILFSPRGCYGPEIQVWAIGSLWFEMITKNRLINEKFTDQAIYEMRDRGLPQVVEGPLLPRTAASLLPWKQELAAKTKEYYPGIDPSYYECQEEILELIFQPPEDRISAKELLEHPLFQELDISFAVSFEDRALREMDLVVTAITESRKLTEIKIDLSQPQNALSCLHIPNCNSYEIQLQKKGTGEAILQGKLDALKGKTITLLEVPTLNASNNWLDWDPKRQNHIPASSESAKENHPYKITSLWFDQPGRSVYRAVDERTGKECMLKFYKREKDLKILGRLQGIPHYANFLDLCQEGAHWVLVTEPIQGVNLKLCYQSLYWTQSVLILRHILEYYGALEERGYMHPKLSLENIYFDIETQDLKILNPCYFPLSPKGKKLHLKRAGAIFYFLLVGGTYQRNDLNASLVSFHSAWEEKHSQIPQNLKQGTLRMLNTLLEPQSSTSICKLLKDEIFQHHVSFKISVNDPDFRKLGLFLSTFEMPAYGERIALASDKLFYKVKSPSDLYFYEFYEKGKSPTLKSPSFQGPILLKEGAVIHIGQGQWLDRENNWK